MRTILFVLLGLFLANFFWNNTAHAQGKGGGGGSGGGFLQRAEKREGSRWTLSEWLEQRDRNRMMDLWLSMNSPSPYEAMIGGSYLSTKTNISNPSSENSFYSYSGEIRAYAQFMGVTGEYENNTQENYNDLAGMVNIRLLGNSLQNSSLTLHLGQRTRTFDVSGTKILQRNLLSQLSLQLYVAKYFGIDAHYRRYEPTANDALGETVGGNQSEAGLFIDFKSVRVFGAWYQDLQTNENATSGATTSTTREGIKTGIKIFY